MGQAATGRRTYDERMATSITLSEFIGAHRDELIDRCRLKVSKRPSHPATAGVIDHGVSVFLAQLCEELNRRPSQAEPISVSAMLHGHELLLRGFTISDVVYDYGDVCQAVTEMAVEKAAPINPSDFRTLNRCLDDAIASAVTEFARGDNVVAGQGASLELATLSDAAITALEVLRSGAVGINGNTGAALLRTLKAIRALADHSPA
jgi:hypothetical protein